MKTLAAIAVFLALAAVIAGLTLLFSPNGGDDRLVGGVLLAGGLTYFWKRTGFRGLK
jgi:hypothetical protein